MTQGSWELKTKVANEITDPCAHVQEIWAVIGHWYHWIPGNSKYGKTGSKQVPVGLLFGTLRWVGADTSLPQRSEFNPSVWFLIWKWEDLKSVLSSHLVGKYRKKGKKKIQKQAGNSASWTQVREFNLIILYLLVCATTWPLIYIDCITWLILLYLFMIVYNCDILVWYWVSLCSIRWLIVPQHGLMCLA